VGFVSLRTACFRNLADEEINTSGKDIFLVGENGQGKTNFLEALYFCSYASSFRGVRDGELVRSGENDCSAAARLDSPSGEAVSVIYRDGKKTVSLDGKRLDDRKDLLGAAPCIVFCHEDMEFAAGPPERRRWFFDQTMSLADPLYLENLRNYRRVLKSRNTLLREHRFQDGSKGRSVPAEINVLLDALDPQLAAYGLELVKKRKSAAEGFSAIFEPLYREISGLDGISVRYAPSWKDEDAETIVSSLAGRREAVYSFGVSLSGPHRDRYVFMRNGREFSARASTGQRRLLALLLRIAQAVDFSGKTGKSPILLLDDVLLELDGEKRRRFLEIMPPYDQAFYTFLPGEPYERYIKNGTMVYHVEGGRLSLNV
jgi:DNA replication and repair protein RecF